jgi:hypothetical protein
VISIKLNSTSLYVTLLSEGLHAQYIIFIVFDMYIYIERDRKGAFIIPS